MADLVRTDLQLRATVDEPLSAGWWLQNLGEQLYSSRAHMDRLDSYYRGDPPLPNSAPTARAAYVQFQRLARVNFAETVVEAVRHRMIPRGFRTGAAGDENGDAAARLLWQANDLDVESVDVHQGMLALGRSYAMVGLVDGDVLVTAEDARQVVTSHDPATRLVRAALKVYRDEAMNTDWAHLFLAGPPGGKAQLLVAGRAAQRQQLVLGQPFRAQDWTWQPDMSGPLPDEMVPVVRFRNQRGLGEFESHLDTLDRINSMLLQRVVIAIMQAFRQRAVKGDLPQHDKAGNAIDYNGLFAAGPDALWQLPEGVEMWESAGTDMTPILAAVKSDLQFLAAATFTPSHLFMPETIQGSAEGAALAREGLVFKTEDRIARASIGWRQVMSLAFRYAGDEQRANLPALEPIWAPPERRSLAERASAAVQATTAGVPWRERMTEIFGFTPELVDRMEQDRAADAFLAAAAQPPQLEQQAAPAPASVRPVESSPSP